MIFSFKKSLILTGLAGLLLMFACKSDPNSILGNGMHDKDDLVAKYDTVFHIEAFSVSDDSLIAQNSSTVLLGTSYSPVFGSETYNLVVQLLTMRTEDQTYSSGHLNSGDLEAIDSVVLYLPYSGVFPLHNRMDGRKLTFSIHEVTEKLVDGSGYDSAYSTNREVAYNPVPLAGAGPITVFPKPFDTIYDSLSASKIVKPLQVHLSKEFGKKLLSAVLQMSAEEQADLGAMTKYLNGIYLKMEPCTREEENIVFSVSNLFIDGANLTVYFAGDETTGTSYQRFLLGPLRYTHVKRDRSLSTDPLYRSQMQNAYDSVSGSERLYVEGSGGSRVRFRVPDFLNVVSGKVVINQAVVVVENIDRGETPDITVPKQLHCFRYINRGTELEILDESNPGGYYNSKTGEYRVNVTRYFQRLAYLSTVDTANNVNFRNYLDLSAVSKERYEQPTRVVLYGPGAPQRNMRLEVIYTLINDTVKN